jgi:hypothetical protein
MRVDIKEKEECMFDSLQVDMTRLENKTTKAIKDKL